MVHSGIWPTMITPFREDGSIDYSLCGKLIEMYDAQGVQGIFACCQSSEMFFLSEDERVELTQFVVDHVPKHISVAASGHVENSLEDQIRTLKRIADTGVETVVLVSNRLAAPQENEDVMRKHIEIILAALPETTFGIYECPYPYKRLQSPEMISWLCDTGRFAFVKDTCSDMAQIGPKLSAVHGSSFKWFNANTDTLLESLRLGAAGLSGIMANFHADLYVRLYHAFLDKDEALAEKLQAALSLMALPAHTLYPVTAKYYLQLLGLPISLYTRSKDVQAFTSDMRRGVKNIWQVSRWLREILGVNI